MNSNCWRGLVLFLGATVVAHASEKIDLSRVDPVPADQPILIEDFFRPNLVEEPDINPSGTRIEAFLAKNLAKRS